MEDTAPRKGLALLTFFVGLIIGICGTYMALRPDSGFIFSTNIQEDNKPTGILTATNEITSPLIPKEPKRNYDEWDSLIPKIQPIVTPLFATKKVSFTELIPGDLKQIIDLTNDGQTEVVLQLQNKDETLGYTTILKKTTDSVEIVKIKNEKGKIENFITAIGATETLENKFELLASDNAFYTGTLSINKETNTKTCTAQFYRWNSATNIFEYNKLLSDIAKQDICK